MRSNDLEYTARIINEAIGAGCGIANACQEVGIDRRTFRRWTTGAANEVIADARPQATRPVPCNKLSEDERARVLEVCHEARFADALPSQIVPALAEDQNPNRWSTQIRNWDRLGEVWLNPEKSTVKVDEKIKKPA